MKREIAYYLQVANLSDKELEDLVLYIHSARNIKCGLSGFDIKTRGEKQVLIALTEGEKISLDLWTHNELASFGNEGYKLQSALGKFDFARELIRGDFKYYK